MEEAPFLAGLPHFSRRPLAPQTVASLTVKEVAVLLRVHHLTVRRKIRSGELPAYRHEIARDRLKVNPTRGLVLPSPLGNPGSHRVLGVRDPGAVYYEPRPWNPAGGVHQTGRMFFTDMEETS
jgi:hypothetical protein